MGVGKKRLADSDASNVDIHAWLAKHGVRKQRASSFLAVSGCRSVENVALFLRFQLPPLRLANRASIASELRDLLGVGPRLAHRIVADLSISGVLYHASALLGPAVW
jgi:hypothetical protein